MNAYTVITHIPELEAFRTSAMGEDTSTYRVWATRYANNLAEQVSLVWETDESGNVEAARIVWVGHGDSGITTALLNLVTGEVMIKGAVRLIMEEHRIKRWAKSVLVPLEA